MDRFRGPFAAEVGEALGGSRVEGGLRAPSTGARANVRHGAGGLGWGQWR